MPGAYLMYIVSEYFSPLDLSSLLSSGPIKSLLLWSYQVSSPLDLSSLLSSGPIKSPRPSTEPSPRFAAQHSNSRRCSENDMLNLIASIVSSVWLYSAGIPGTISCNKGPASLGVGLGGTPPHMGLQSALHLKNTHGRPWSGVRMERDVAEDEVSAILDSFRSWAFPQRPPEASASGRHGVQEVSREMQLYLLGVLLGASLVIATCPEKAAKSNFEPTRLENLRRHIIIIYPKNTPRALEAREQQKRERRGANHASRTYCNMLHVSRCVQKNSSVSWPSAADIAQ
uniref:Uncharacterized protein n=1 Tax=Timema tahoe TaxID=61484 RepID=A0A7R9IPJ5_9NEOP|nr:unnamed protein product [Timema tahoe]